MDEESLWVETFNLKEQQCSLKDSQNIFVDSDVTDRPKNFSLYMNEPSTEVFLLGER